MRKLLDLGRYRAAAIGARRMMRKQNPCAMCEVLWGGGRGRQASARRVGTMASWASSTKRESKVDASVTARASSRRMVEREAKSFHGVMHDQRCNPALTSPSARRRTQPGLRRAQWPPPLTEAMAKSERGST